MSISYLWPLTHLTLSLILWYNYSLFSIIFNYAFDDYLFNSLLLVNLANIMFIYLHFNEVGQYINGSKKEMEIAENFMNEYAKIHNLTMTFNIIAIILSCVIKYNVANVMVVAIVPYMSIITVVAIAISAGLKLGLESELKI